MRSAEWIFPILALGNVARAFVKSVGSEAFSAITRCPGCNSSLVPPQNPLAINSCGLSWRRKLPTRSSHLDAPTPVCKTHTSGVRFSRVPRKIAPSCLMPLSKRINALLSAASANVTTIISLPSAGQSPKLSRRPQRWKFPRSRLLLQEERRVRF